MTLPVLEILPGDSSPHPPCYPSGIAQRFGVRIETVWSWLDQGLPYDQAGRIDPFACSNWLCQGRLDQAPILARRWRRFFSTFKAFREGRETARSLTWRRIHRLYPPSGLHEVRWFLPDPQPHPQQEVLAISDLQGSLHGLERHPHGQVLTTSLGTRAEVQTLRGETTVILTPRLPVAAWDRAREAMVPLLRDLVHTSAYIYRHHVHDRPALDEAQRHRTAGTCLDLALNAAACLAAQGWQPRLLAGLIAREGAANPHYWLEVAVDGTWMPVDPSIAAIARMLGQDPDPWLVTYIGGCDSRRIILAIDDPLVQSPGRFISRMPGEVEVVTADDRHASAWACQDWVCGDCSASFRTCDHVPPGQRDDQG